MSVDNILKIYNLSTPAERRHGVTWYANAYSDCERIGTTFEVPTNIVAGVVSALSPNNKWERNIQNAHVLIDAFLDGEDITNVKVSTYHAMKNKAWQILHAINPDSDSIDDYVNDREIEIILNGQKITSFFNCILGHDDCCIDGHAKGVYEGVRFPLTSSHNYISKSYYQEIKQAYIDAGNLTTYRNKRLRAYEIQAITWLTWKRIHDI